jgi:hypothetical protein
MKTLSINAFAKKYKTGYKPIARLVKFHRLTFTKEGRICYVDEGQFLKELRHFNSQRGDIARLSAKEYLHHLSFPPKNRPGRGSKLDVQTIGEYVRRVYGKKPKELPQDEVEWLLSEGLSL